MPFLYLQGKTFDLAEQLKALGGSWEAETRSWAFKLPSLADYKERNGEDAFGLLVLLSENPLIRITTKPVIPGINPTKQPFVPGKPQSSGPKQYAPTYCPNCGKGEAVRFSKDRNEYYCWKNLGGCGATGMEKSQLLTEPPQPLKNQEVFESDEADSEIPF